MKGRNPFARNPDHDKSDDSSMRPWRAAGTDGTRLVIIWLASYPRSGNTFLRILLKNCFGADTYSIYNDRDIGEDPALADLTGHKQLKYDVSSAKFDLTNLRQQDASFFLKTHEKDRRLVGEGDKVIYIIRDGREATLSYQRYHQNVRNTKVPLTELLFGLRFPGAGWGEHVHNWTAGEPDDTLVLRFEDLVSEPLAAASRIEEFIGFPSIKLEAPSFETLKGVNSKFFNRGEKASFERELSRTSEVLFFLSGFAELLESEYVDDLPSSLSSFDKEDFLRLEEGWRNQENGIPGLRASLNAQAQEREKRTQELRASLNALRTENKTASIALEASSIALETSKAQVGSLKDKLGTLSKTLKTTERGLETLRAEKDKILRDRDDLRGQIAAIRRSLSWRLTMPLRGAKLFFVDNRLFWRLIRKRAG